MQLKQNANFYLIGFGKSYAALEHFLAIYPFCVQIEKSPGTNTVDGPLNGRFQFPKRHLFKATSDLYIVEIELPNEAITIRSVFLQKNQPLSFFL